MEEGCNEAFLKKSQLKKHVCSHTGQLPYSCYECERTFKYPSGLKWHIKTVHLCEKKYYCGYEGCCEGFFKNSELKKHLKEKHPIIEKSIQCNICNQKLKKKDYLKEHMKIHNPNREIFLCGIDGCTKSYPREANLKLHIKAIHEGQGYNYKCSHCEKSFISKSRIKRHEKKYHSSQYNEDENLSISNIKEEKIKKKRKLNWSGTFLGIMPNNNLS
jgi:uncharacterized Zn-finger protein